MTYIEKLMSAIKFDDEMLTPGEIETLRDIISWQIQDQLCPLRYCLFESSSTQCMPSLKSERMQRAMLENGGRAA